MTDYCEGCHWLNFDPDDAECDYCEEGDLYDEEGTVVGRDHGCADGEGETAQEEDGQARP